MEKNNERIVLIPERGLCYHPNWPNEPIDPEGGGSPMELYYEYILPKALSEAVLIDESSKTAANLWDGNFKDYQPYFVPTGYRVEVKKLICHWCELSYDPKCNGLCKSTKSAKEESSKLEPLAYLLPIEKPKEESQEELWNEACKILCDSSGFIESIPEITQIRLRSKFTITRTQH